MTNGIFEGYSDHFDEEVRLIILKALDGEQSKSLNDSLIEVALRTFGVMRSREYLRSQLAWLEAQGRAVKLTAAGSAIIAQLTRQGSDHLNRIQPIVGVKLPSLPS